MIAGAGGAAYLYFTPGCTKADLRLGGGHISWPPFSGCIPGWARAVCSVTVAGELSVEITYEILKEPECFEAALPRSWTVLVTVTGNY